MADLCKLIWCAFAGLFRSRASLQAEILVLRHQLNVLGRKSPARVTFSGIDRLMLAGLYGLVPDVRAALQIVKPDTVNPLASCRLQGLLALEIAIAKRSSEGPGRNSPAYSRDEHRQPTLWRTPHSRRIAQARHRCRADYGGKVHGEVEAAARPRLEDLPTQSC
jgi:hypothetical protein